MELTCSIHYPITQLKLEYKLQSRIRDPYVRFNGRGENIYFPSTLFENIVSYKITNKSQLEKENENFLVQFENMTTLAGYRKNLIC